MPDARKFEKQFFNALRDIFVGAKVEGDSGYVNLMRIKSRYYEQGVFPQLQKDINAALLPFPDFREELFDKLYTFFQRYFSESGSIYFRYTALHQNVYEKVYTDDRDVILFWKTHMLYYVKTDRIFTSLNVEVDGAKFFFDAGKMTLKKSNEKREVVYTFRKVQAEDTLVFDVAYSEKGKTTKIDDMLKDFKKAGVKVSDETLNKAFRVFEKQSEVDYFINKNARAFLQEQFDLWLYQYLFAGQNIWGAERLAQLQTLKAIAYKVIAFISQFEDELVKIWNKPKFVRNSHYVLTLDYILSSAPSVIASDPSVIASAAKQSPPMDETASLGEERPPRSDSPSVLDKLLAHPNLPQQVQEWRDLGMLAEDFQVEMLTQKDMANAPLYPQYQYLPVDTCNFKDLELEILGLFDDLDSALDGWLVHSENHQALNSLNKKFAEQVKIIYIDPPYNTGGDEFIYGDKFQNSSWLTMIENRLSIGREFLSKNGVLITSIGREEVFEIEQLYDMIFGVENQIGDLIWEKGRKNDAKFFSLGHDYILVYAKDKAFLNEKNTVWREEKPGAHEILVEFRRLQELHEDNFSMIETEIRKFYEALPKGHISLKHRRYNRVDANGLWRDDNMSWPGGDGPRYDVVHPVTKKPCKPPDGGWRFATLERFKLYEKHGFIEYREDHTEPPMLKRYLNFVSTEFDQESKNRRNTANDGEEEANVQVMPSVFYKNQQPPVLELRHIMGKDVFKNPKDPSVLSRLFQYITSSKGLFLDFFGGSGTTAHAVINANRDDRGKRKYILVEMGEYINTVVLPRIKKVAFSDQWKDGQASGGKGVSHFIKYYDLEQYENVLSRAHFADADLYNNPYEDPYHRYVFLRDIKLLDAIEIDAEQNKVHFHPERLYPDIDLAETLSQRRGKWIKRITAEYVEFQDGEKISLTDPDWQVIKPLVWWQ